MYVYLGTGLLSSVLLAVGSAAFAILLYNPKLLFDTSFALSFMAIHSLVLLTPPAQEILNKIPGIKKLPSFFNFFSARKSALRLE